MSSRKTSEASVPIAPISLSSLPFSMKARARREAAEHAAQALVDLELARRQDRDRDLREPAPLDLVAAQITEVRALRAVDANRHDHGIALVRDHRRAVIDLHQAAGDG